MKTLKITPGIWKYQETSEDVVSEDKMPGDIICEAPESWPDSMTHWKDNAQLIAEAGTVANETGLTPRETLEQRNELLEVIKELREYNIHKIVPSATLKRIDQAIKNITT